jgi:hypothetical protein
MHPFSRRRNLDPWAGSTLAALPSALSSAAAAAAAIGWLGGRADEQQTNSSSNGVVGVGVGKRTVVVWTIQHSK